MSNLSVGDLAQSFLLQRRGHSLKTEITRLTEELASGQVSDIKAVLAGNHSFIGDIEKDMRLLEGFGVAATEASQFADAAQRALGRVQDSSTELFASLLTVSDSTIDTVIYQGSAEAEARLTEVLSALNSNLAGRNLFFGVGTGSVPLNDSEAILADLRAVVAGAATAGDVLVATQTWFDDPNGFSAAHYRGSSVALAPFRIAEGETATIDIKANDKIFRDIVRHTAVAAIASDNNLPLSQSDRRQLMREAAEGLISSQQKLTSVRGTLGNAEARIEALQSRNAAEKISLEFARNQLLAADPFETATRLEDVQFQLQALYTVTARMSDLTLVNFLR